MTQINDPVKPKNLLTLNNPETDWRDWAKAFVLLAMGIYLLVLIETGNLSNYINVRFQWLSYVAAGIFLLLGGWSLVRLLRGAQVQHAANAAFVHTPVGWGVIAICAIPLVLATLVPSRPLGADAVSGDISLSPVGVGTAAEFSRAPEERNILDWLREFSRMGTPAALNDLPVDVIGFVYREPDMGAEQFMVARFTMSCCVADAFAIGLPVQYADAASLPTDTWVRITGTLRAGDFQEQVLPVIRPEQVQIVAPPETPYLYS